MYGLCGRDCTCNSCRFRTTNEQYYSGKFPAQQCAPPQTAVPFASSSIPHLTSSFQQLHTNVGESTASAMDISVNSHSNVNMLYHSSGELEVTHVSHLNAAPSISSANPGMSDVVEYVIVTPALSKKLKETSPNEYVPLFHVKTQLHNGGLTKIKNSTPEGTWNWNNASFVKIPISSRYTNADSRKEREREQVMIRKWEIIQAKLHEFMQQFPILQPIQEVDFGKWMKSTVAEYHHTKATEFNFQILNDPALAHRLNLLLPIIATHALQLETRLANPIPILEAGKPKTILLSRNLCCSLLANAFFCTFPVESRENLPDFNFFRLFHKGEHDSGSNVKVEKLTCILAYFYQMQACQNVENTIISFERRCIPNHIEWCNSKAKLCPVHVERNKGIEDAEDMLQVDFANKVVGGGVLNDGAVMEEIRFVTSPELIVSRLFTEALGNDEVLVVTGTRQFSLYSGYSSTFKYSGWAPQKASTIDTLGRGVTQVVAMDAYYFSTLNKFDQYSKRTIDRELHKCYVGFIRRIGNPQMVATGNWGCGAFNGDPELKFFVQWMAASQVSRTGLVYHTRGDEKQSLAIEYVTSLLRKSNITIDDLYRYLLKYKEMKPQYRQTMTVFEYVEKMVTTPESHWRRLFNRPSWFYIQNT